MFWHKKKEPTLVEQAVSAVDRIHVEIADLREERIDALSSFRDTANWLGEINAELCQKSELCETLVSQLEDALSSMGRQINDNDKVRAKILDIIGE